MTVHRIHPWLLLAALLWLVLPWEALAQVDTTRSALPDIAPREVEIRGQLDISLPSLQRQPLVGFNPPPRVPRPPAGRRPFVETYKQASADLPASPLQQPMPPSVLGAAYPPAQGLVETSVGRYFSRAVVARLQAPLSDQVSFLLRTDYRGSDGHTPFDESPDVNAPFNTFEGMIGVQGAGTRWAAGFTFSGFVDSYDLYGASIGSLLSQPEREGRGVVGTLHLSTLAGTPVEARLNLSYGTTRYETEIPTGGIFPDGLFDSLGFLGLSEQRFEADTDLSFPVEAGDVWIAGVVSVASLADERGGGSAYEGTYSAYEGGGGFRFQRGRTLTLSAGARFLIAFSDSPDSSDQIRKGYLSPDLYVEFLPTSGVRLYARNRPGVEPNTVSDVFRINPYLTPQPQLRATLRTIDAEVGARVFAGPLQLALAAGHQNMPQYLFFENEEGLFSRGTTALRYSKARVTYAGGSVSMVLPGGLHAMLGATYRHGRLTEEQTDIPYFAPVLGEATLSYSFAQSRGLLQLTGHYESARYIDRQHSRKLETYLDLDAEASFNVTPLLGLVFGVENIGGGDHTRWDNYPESRYVIGAGLRVNW